LYRSPFKANLDETLERRSAFYALPGDSGRRAMAGTILANFRVTGRPGRSHLGCIPDPAGMLSVILASFESRRDLLDDWMPLAQTHLGMGLFGAIFGSDIVWMPDDETSWSNPPLPDWPNDLEARLKFDPDNPMIALARRVIRYYRSEAHGRFGIGVLETIDALNLLVALRGATQAYQDLYLFPAEVEEVMALGAEWNRCWLEMQWEEAGAFAGGWCSIVDWLPTKTVWLSVDADTYCRPEVYAEQSRPHMQRLVDNFGACWQHLHAPGMRLLPEIVKLRNLVGIQIGEDIGHPRPIDRLSQVQQITGDIPLQVGCTWDEFCRGIESATLPGSVEYHVSGAPSAQAANEMAAEARRYRAPLGRTPEPNAQVQRDGQVSC
jgi:hypothetical protein